MKDLDRIFAELKPRDALSTLRYVIDSREELRVRRHHVQPVVRSVDEGVMVSVIDQGGYGYAATSDLSKDGIYLALRSARHWAQRSHGVLVHLFVNIFGGILLR